jgi:mannose-6-phosphate isomerase
MPQSNVRLEILGTSIGITVDEDIPYLEKLLADYQAKVEAIEKSTGLKDPLKIAILTGYSLCDELRKAREEGAGPETEEALRRTMNLITQLDQTIAKDPPPRMGFAGLNNGEDRGQGLYVLKNPVKHYEWGSPTWIPEILGKDNPEGEPWAELWMGAHPASSSILCAGGTEKSLARLIADDPQKYLGETRSGTLPFLFKLLAASRPLSIQAHPGKEQARQGWQRENERGIPLDAPERNYRDDNHKPEILCALSPFTALCGFRSPVEISSLLSLFFANAPISLQSGLAPLWAALANTGEGALSALQLFLKSLFAIPPELRRELTGYILSTPASSTINGELGSLIRSLAGYYPEDPGILSPLYLNLIHLKKGQAIYLPAGILHAYVEGFGVELMANSDNVLRGGLSSKHVDLNELMRILYFHPFMPELLNPPEAEDQESAENQEGAEGQKNLKDQESVKDQEGAKGPAEPPSQGERKICGNGVFTYPSPCKEFSLSVINNREGPFPFRGPAIIVITRGYLRVSAGEAGEAGEAGKTWELGRGESAFIPPGARLTLGGDYTLYAASVPAGAPPSGAGH